ncbi:MAG TPA: ferritin-like domain-containing protein [Chloroflexota bacterium]
MTETAPTLSTNPWLHPLAPTQPPSLSERLIRALEAHSSAEAHDVATCEQVAEKSPDPVVRLLVGMIVEDEQRHHSLLQSMIHRLQEEVEFVASPTSVPVPESPQTGDGEMASTLRALIRDEHEGARHLRHLARQEPQLYGGLYPVLLETIARDSEKHATILRFLLLRLEDRVR